MSLIDKNKVFFGLIHYILSEQKNVDWIIKSSLIDFTGISSLLEEKPYKVDNILDEIIDYVKSIKPYHVQFSKYFEKYETATEYVNIPMNDWVNKTLKLRFDKIKPTSDVLLNFYETISDDVLPSSSEYNSYNTIIFFVKDDMFYKRKKIFSEEYNKNIWIWDKLDFKPIDGLYFEEKNEDYYIYQKKVFDTNVNDYINVFRKASDKEIDEILNYHHGNRLFKLGLHNNDEITKELNANFKGLEINGGVFDIGKFGYDVFDYDTNDYDTPTIIYDYCLINPEETFDSSFGNIISYNKEFTIPSNHQFKLIENDDVDLSDSDVSELTIKIKNKNGIISDVKEFSINNGYIDIFKQLGLDNTLYVINENLNYCQVITSYPFIESDTDIIKRKYVTKNDLIEKISQTGEYYGGLDIPNNLDSSKLIIQLKSNSDGKRLPLDPSYYTIKNNKFYINNSYILNYYDHIIMTSFDYKYLYDKIYLWEDKYGRSNNIINLDGNKFLRAIYEKGRPSELVVSQPNNDLFIYKTYQNNNRKIFRNDFKNDMFSKQVNLSHCSKIDNLTFSDDANLIIDSITLSSIKNMDDAPGKVLINSEIIEYNEIDRSSKTISKLKRGSSGSFVNMNTLENHIPHSTTHKIGDIVIPYNNLNEIKKSNKYVSYNISDVDENMYTCPSGVKEDSKIYVSKLSKINLLEDVRLNSEKILIDNPNVVNSYETFIKLLKNDGESSTGEYVLKINDDNIPFKKITKLDESKYCIENFQLPSKYDQLILNEVIYDSKTSFISSSIPVELVLKNNNYPRLDNVVYSNDEFIIEQIDGSLSLDIVEKSTKDNSEVKNYIVKINETDDLYTISGSFTNNIMNGSIFNIDGSSFGNIVNNVVIKNDKTIYAKIDNNKFITVDTVIRLINPDLHKNECIKINVVDEEFSYTEEGSIIDDSVVTITFKTNPSNATLTIDAGEFIDINGVITVPRGTIIKYKATCKGYYDLEGTIEATSTQEILLTLTKEIIIEDADYVVLRYIWTDGKDLDTDTKFTNIDNISSINNLSIGWNRGTNVPRGSSVEDCVLYWAGDNTGSASESSPQEENILINIKNLLSDSNISMLPSEIIATLSATFYSSVGKNPVKLELVGYKGGTMSVNNYRFINNGGEHIKIRDNMGIEHDSISLFVTNISETIHTYNTIATINIDKNNGQFKLSSYDDQ